MVYSEKDEKYIYSHSQKNKIHNMYIICWKVLNTLAMN